MNSNLTILSIFYYNSKISYLLMSIKIILFTLLFIYISCTENEKDDDSDQSDNEKEKSSLIIDRSQLENLRYNIRKGKHEFIDYDSNGEPRKINHVVIRSKTFDDVDDNEIDNDKNNDKESKGKVNKK